MLASTLVPGYDITEVIYEGINTIIYRGTSHLNQEKVILKILKEDYPTLDAITRLKHEYKITENLNLEGVVKILRLETEQNRLLLVLEDFGGQSLKQLLSLCKLELLEFLNIAVQLAKALISLHSHNIIHKDVKADNIIINPKTREVRLTDFSIASRLGKEKLQLTNPNQLEGTLTYMSPEQTGRMNRVLDYRTDFYSLGVTFYEMLTGRLPFQSNDPLELVHFHIAKQPVAIQQLNPEVPKAIANVVEKLMAKNAEDRYQTGKGLLADLELCREQLEITGTIIEFPPGRLDVLSQLLIPQKLYGRETQVTKLLDAFERVSKGSCELMLVSGYSGIGKSSVVYEVNKPITQKRGYFISGKFDQFKRNIPYASLIQAFNSLMQQLLTESATQLEKWRNKILTAVGANGQVIIDVIPEVELIIGKQPEVPQLGGTEAQNRFNRVFTEFIHVFAKKEHPLVIFLDDLQWADSGTLKLMQILTADPESKYLLLIGAYRDNEVNPAHPLIQTLEEIEKNNTIVNNIVLQPLESADVTLLVAETLKDNTERVNTLAELICNKTGRNPFFITQLLQALYQENLLKFDFTPFSSLTNKQKNQGMWNWDIEQIQAIGITDKSVVDLVANRIKKLPESTQQVLQLAACIGDTFKLEVLSIVNQKSLVSTAKQLDAALQAGLILPLSKAYKIPLVFDEDIENYEQDINNQNFYPKNLKSNIIEVGYRFLHDRVQQAAYGFIPESEKQVTHLKIGQLLLKQTPPELFSENILDIVNQLNVGVDLITEQSEKDELAKLNLMAGKKAKTATAYEAAVKYLNLGLELLKPDSWQSIYQLTFDLYVEAAEAQYLKGDFQTSETLCNLSLQEVNTILEKTKIYQIKIQSYILQNKILEALEEGIKALNLLGVRLPKKPKNWHFLEALVRTKIILARQPIKDLVYLPRMTDPYKLAAMQILMLVNPAASQAGSLIFPLTILGMVRLSVEYGNSAPSAYGYSIYGAILCDKFEDIEAGYRFGLLGLSLLEPMNANSYRCKVFYIFNAMIQHFHKHHKETITSLQHGMQSGLQTGDIEFASYCNWTVSINLFLSGNNLEVIHHNIFKYFLLTQNLNMIAVAYSISSIRQAILNFQGSLSIKDILKNEAFDEAEMIAGLGNNSSWLSTFYFTKTILSYFFQDYPQAIENARLTEKYQESNPGFLMYCVNNYYYSLALLANYKNVTSTEQKQYLKKVAANQKKMHKWAHHAACNFQHKYDLVEAEKARIFRKNIKAMHLYDRAIAGAKENEYTQEEALGNELAALFYLNLGKDKIAKTYMTDAYYGYIRWGAFAKVKDLEERYPNLIIRSETSTPSQDISRTIVSNSARMLESSSNSNSILDLTTVMKASEAITSEIVLDNLLDKLLSIILENAAAQKGCLILLKDNQLFIEAIDNDQDSDLVVLQSTPIEESQDIPLSVIHYVTRTQQPLVLKDATKEEIYKEDSYILRKQPKSVLCAPIFYQGKFTGIIYLENNQVTGAFTNSRLEILKLLTSQAAIAIENARLYAREQEKSQQLQQSLETLQQTQAQLVQTEKISSLGQLVAGVAHEVNNPVGFIAGNLSIANQYIEDLLQLLNLYQTNVPSPPEEIESFQEEIDLDYLLEDLPKMINSMELGTERIRDIMQSLRNFSRTDTADKKPVNVHEGIETTLMILQHRLKAKAERPTIQIIKKYEELPLVRCYSGQLNQAFMNLLANAIDALDESNEGKTYAEIEKNPNVITIRTSAKEEKVTIQIADNGPGMTEEVRSKLFKAFFTTKPEGKGTGLGLSISYQIITEKHGGNLYCISSPGNGAEFVIELPLEVTDDEE
ncbi:AAA family ATPase [Plectonema cf. radiosum LEGE 06105]|uniref:histidine kinase n=1 Tax=Plectonema cf. radiosum LEGE 06105 TaxID=945769 RepID=A0A8J7F7C9_9CYAN|nr:trifunctional serine/threonine-protein kinase/ATP-binding protein/sensor histidine kinase [Plectonema radiosum]MBE9213369.1 AAA family ATPase [Plectonema cf. radiosum LEGE 06105]